MATVYDMLKCPKCSKKMMGKSYPQTFGKEYFSHCCHIYFGVNELINQWGYDAGDLSPQYPVTYGDYKRNNSNPLKFYSEFDDGEPYWANLAEYQDAQSMVTRMIMGIPEIDEYQDMLNTYADAFGVGIQ